MAKRTPGQVYALLLDAGFTSAQAATMTAIAGAESGYRNDALGDLDLQDGTWGPSFGLFQIRTLKGQTGSGSNRDISRLADEREQARAAYEISRRGTDFSPWSVYNTGAYRKFLPQVMAIIGNTITGGGGGPFPTFGPEWLPWNWVSNAGNQAVNAGLSGARTIALEAAFIALGLVLVGVGVARAVAPAVARKYKQLRPELL